MALPKTIADLGLPAASVLHALPAREREVLVRRARRFQFKKRQFIFREGFEPAGLFVISDGRVKIFRTTQGGKEIIVHIAGAGELLGFHHLLLRQEHRLSASALEDTEVFLWPHRLLRSLLSQFPDFTLMLCRQLALEHDRLLDKLAEVSTQQVRTRIAGMLMRMYRRYGTEADNRTIGITLLREDLAHLVGANTETLVRVLSEFRKEGFVQLKGKKILLINRKALQALARQK